ncbi:hypothetical protein CRENBAI_023006 [Crenichthys baileyi]|uniref:Uncharacterized protein n=1 Tax=Crenichthys baileyi TaxID=28760 RepID=A0AAV9RLF8_9TELE
MANNRTKLRGYSVSEVMCNALKHKSPADQKSAKNVKKPRMAEVNYLQPYPAGEDEESQEQEMIQLLIEDEDEDSVAQDLALQVMKVYSMQTDLSKGTKDIGIVIDGTKVLADLGNFPRACAMLMGLTYALNLAYPKELRCTFEAFQKRFLELDWSKLSPKVNSLKSKLLAKEKDP